MDKNKSEAKSSSDSGVQYDLQIILGISNALLALHLLNFVLRKNLRNLPGKNVASFCLSRLLLYLFLALHSLLSIQQSQYCVLYELFTLYVSLTSLGWCLVICYDVRSTLFRSLNLTPDPFQQRRLNKTSYRRYLSFSLLLPLPILAWAISIDRLLSTGNDHRDNEYCFFHSYRPIDVILIFPVGITFLITLLFYASSMRLIFRKNQRQPIIWYEYRRRFFILYCSLTLIFLISTTLGFLSRLIQFAGLKWYYLASNLTLTLYIVMAFTYRDKLVQTFNNAVSNYYRENEPTVNRNDLIELLDNNAVLVKLIKTPSEPPDVALTSLSNH